MAQTLDPMQLESMVYAAAQTMPRIAAVFLVMPLFSGPVVSGLVRGGLIVMLAFFMAPAAGPLTAPGLVNWIFVVAKEALIGSMLGLGFGVLIWAVQSMGDLIDLQTGASNVEFFDPVAGHEGGSTSELLGWLVMALFVATGGLLALVGALVDSYRLWPVASFVPKLGQVLELFVVRQGDALFTWTVKLAAPVVTVLVLVDFGLGLLGRAAPRLNVFEVAQPLKSLIAALVLVLVLAFMFESLQGFLQPDNSVIAFLRAAL